LHYYPGHSNVYWRHAIFVDTFKSNINVRNVSLSNNGIGFRDSQGDVNVVFRNSTLVNNTNGIVSARSGNGYAAYHNNLFLNNRNSGLYLDYAYNNTIHSNIFDSNYDGIKADAPASENIIRDNIITNSTDAGIFFTDVQYENPIYNNVIRSNSEGIRISDSKLANVTRNQISSSNDAGIYLSASQQCTFVKNRLTDNTKGILVSFSSNNNFYDNYLNNTQNIDVGDEGSRNIWNTTKSTGPNIVDGPNIGGNAWANPSNTGYSQICADSNGDGFCDVPWTIPDGNGDLDKLPLHIASPISHTIFVTVGFGGTITPAGPEVPVPDGGSQTFTITANSGYRIVDVVVDSVSQGSISSYPFTNVHEDHTISATFEPIPPTSHTIFVTAGVGGTITPAGPEVTVPDGGSQTFTITANSGYRIVDVAVDSVSQGSISSFPFTNVHEDHTISATFEPIPPTSHTIFVTTGVGGTITPAGPEVTVPDGGSQTFTITANSGYRIVDVVVDSVSQGSINSYPFTNVHEDHTISATFEPIPPTSHTIFVTAGVGGTITPAGPEVTVPDGGSQTFTITANSGYRIVDVVVDGVSQGPISSYPFTNVHEDHTISATFLPISNGTYVINSSADPFTIINPYGINTYPEGTNKAYVTQGKPGSELLNVVVDDITHPKPANDVWTFTNITANHNIKTVGQAIPGQVHVIFSLHPGYGPAPLTVSFTDESLGNPTSFYWQFGDGYTSTEQNPVHTYHIPGVYTVTLRATNNQSGGIGVWHKAITVTDGVIPQPTPTPVPGVISALFTASPVTGNAPLNVQFQDQSSGNPVLWTWDFGDGQTSQEQNPLHQYTSKGTYSVTLLVQNDKYSGSLTKTGYIEVM